MVKTLRLFLVAALAMMFGNVMAQEVTLDFTPLDNPWGIPTENATAEASFSNGGYTIKLSAPTSYKIIKQKVDNVESYSYVFMGKKDAALTLPTFSFDVEKIEVEGNSGASASVKQNIFVGENAVSTETTSAKVTNTYMIKKESQAAGNVYVLKVTNAYNTQITKIKIYKASGVTAPEISGSEVFSGSTQVTITADEGAAIYYTTDGSEPSSNSLTYTAPFTINSSCTVKAIASKGGVLSSVVSKSFVMTTGDGSETNPFTIADMLSLPSDYEATDKWVKGIIVGSIKNSAIEETPSQTSNVALAAAAGEKTFANVVPVQLSDANKGAVNVVDNPTNIGKELLIHGDITKYFGNLGVKNTSDYKFAGGGETGLERVWDFTVLPTQKIEKTGNMDHNLGDAGVFANDGGASWQIAYNIADFPEGSKLMATATEEFTPTKDLVFSAMSNKQTVIFRNYPAAYGGIYLFLNRACEFMVPAKAGQTISLDLATTNGGGATKKITSQDVVETFDDEGTPTNGIKAELDQYNYKTFTLTAKVENVYLAFEGNVCIGKITVKDGGTGIAAVKTANKVADNVMYNLAGQKVDAAYKGMVIMNGRKFVNK